VIHEREPRDTDPASLMADVIAGLARLVKGEVALARAEAKEGLRTAGAGFVKIALAGVFGIVGLNVLAGAAVAGLVEAGLGAGPAGLIVGLGLLGGALAFALAARSALKMTRLIPDRALRGLQQDAEAVRAGLSNKDVQHV
jgi:hypothetical protein